MNYILLFTKVIYVNCPLDPTSNVEKDDRSSSSIGRGWKKTTYTHDQPLLLGIGRSRGVIMMYQLRSESVNVLRTREPANHRKKTAYTHNQSLVWWSHDIVEILLFFLFYYLVNIRTCMVILYRFYKDKKFVSVFFCL